MHFFWLYTFMQALLKRIFMPLHQYLPYSKHTPNSCGTRVSTTLTTAASRLTEASLLVNIWQSVQENNTILHQTLIKKSISYERKPSSDHCSLQQTRVSYKILPISLISRDISFVTPWKTATSRVDSTNFIFYEMFRTRVWIWLGRLCYSGVLNKI